MKKNTFNMSTHTFLYNVMLQYVGWYLCPCTVDYGRIDPVGACNGYSEGFNVMLESSK